MNGYTDKNRKMYYRYSICIKKQTVREMFQGSSISEVCRRYNIKGAATVQGWIKRFGDEKLRIIK
jgi:transposase-like protein